MACRTAALSPDVLILKLSSSVRKVLIALSAPRMYFNSLANPSSLMGRGLGGGPCRPASCICDALVDRRHTHYKQWVRENFAGHSLKRNHPPVELPWPGLAATRVYLPARRVCAVPNIQATARRTNTNKTAQLLCGPLRTVAGPCLSSMCRGARRARITGPDHRNVRRAKETAQFI